MQIAFLPVSLDKISPTIGVEEALSLMSEGTRSTGVDIYEDNNGNLGVLDEDGEVVSFAAYAERGRQRMEAFKTACEVLLLALRKSDLRAYVWGPSGHAFHIPRFYWNSLTTHSVCGATFNGMDGVAGYDPAMAGQPIMFAEREFVAWWQSIIERERADGAGGVLDDLAPVKRASRPPPLYRAMIFNILVDYEVTRHRLESEGRAQKRRLTAKIVRQKICTDYKLAEADSIPLESIRYNIRAVKSDPAFEEAIAKRIAARAK